MAYEQLKGASLPRAISDVVSDVVQLFQAEVRLARTEISSKIGMKAQAAYWYAVAGVLGLVTLLLIAQAAVVWLVAVGIEAQWAYLVVAAAFCVLAAVCAAVAKSAARDDVMPEHTLHQVNKDIQLVKEQLP